MDELTTVRAFRLGPDEVITDAALAGMVGWQDKLTGGSVSAARVVDDWIEFDMVGLASGISVTQISTRELPADW